MELCAYLNFNGNCAEAFKFYEKTLGGKIVMSMTNGESPMKDKTPPDQHNRTMHVRLQVGDRVLMGSDAPPEYYCKPQGFAVSFGVKSYEDAERVFQALAERGTVSMPFQKTFWAPGFGMATDRFGIAWMVSCEVAAAS